MDKSYKGPRLPANEEITLNFLIEMMEFFKSGGILHQVYARVIMTKVIKSFFFFFFFFPGFFFI